MQNNARTTLELLRRRETTVERAEAVLAAGWAWLSLERRIAFVNLQLDVLSASAPAHRTPELVQRMRSLERGRARLEAAHQRHERQRRRFGPDL